MPLMLTNLRRLSITALLTTLCAFASLALAAGESRADEAPTAERGVRERLPFGLALEAPMLGVLDAFPIPLVGLRFDYTLRPSLAIEARLDTIGWLTALQAGMRWWILESNLTPTLFLDAGAALTLDGDPLAVPIVSAGASLDYAFDFGLTLSLEAGAVLSLYPILPFWFVNPSIGCRF